VAQLPLTLFFDITNRRFVQGVKSTGAFILPELQDQDRIPIQLQILRLSPGGGSSAPYEIVDPTGYSATVAIVNSALSTTLALIELSTVEGLYLTGLLNLNTTEMGTAFTGVKRIEAVFAVSADDGTGTVGAQRPIVITYAAIRSGTPTPTPGISYLTEAQILALVARKVGAAGDTITLTSPDGTKAVILSCDNNGAFNADSQQ
jgi:hypothetical protein